MRSVWKLPFFNRKLWRYYVRGFFKKDIYTIYHLWNRQSFISEAFIGKRFWIYVGNTYRSVVITRLMLGYRFSDISLTKKRFYVVHAREKVKRGRGRLRNKTRIKIKVKHSEQIS